MDENTYRNRTNTINKVVVGLQRVGIAFGPMQLLTVKAAAAAGCSPSPSR